MRILIIAIGSYGDVLPLLGLAVSLQQRGHLITFFSNDHFAPLTRLGVGHTISPRSFRGFKVAKSIENLLSSHAVKNRCVAVAEHFTGINPLEETCDLLESVLI